MWRSSPRRVSSLFLNVSSFFLSMILLIHDSAWILPVMTLQESFRQWILPEQETTFPPTLASFP
jgi:hypothetical protein